MRVYVAGPMSNYPNHNRESFEMAERLLIGRGHEVVTPFEFESESGFSDVDPDEYRVPLDAVRFDLEQVISSGAIYMLYGWELSRGARAEHAVAVWLGKHIWYE